MRFPPFPLYVALLLCVVGAWFYVGWTLAPKGSLGAMETIYVVNHAPQYISDKAILRDIPAWEQAANKDFAPVWGTTQVKIELVSKVPDGGIGALFVKDGPVQGALAYHTVTKGVPGIVVYAGVGDFYGYSNSVSFTHELFELLGDPTVSQLNQGYPYPQICFAGSYPEQCGIITPGTSFINETADPVEANVYHINGVAISDFITPNWFNDQVRGPYDFMNTVQAPLTVNPGGYVCFFWTKWDCITNFRHVGRDAGGFLKGEKDEIQ